jgi:Lrp/AsnC family transcriptional regulator of lysine biosynthesis
VRNPKVRIPLQIYFIDICSTDDLPLTDEENLSDELDKLRFSQTFLSLNNTIQLMDDVDLEILKILKKDARTKYVKIARSVGLTEGAIRRRIKKLIEDGIIKKFTVDTTAELEGIVLIRTEPTRTKDAIVKVRKIAERVFEISGSHDIAALIQAYTIDELNRRIDEIRKVPEVLNTNTLIKLKD